LFAEVWTNDINKELGVSVFEQMNEVTSREKCIRGLHFQHSPFVGKLIKVVRGTIYDYILDIRLNSPTFGKAIIIELNDPCLWVWVPPGMAHGVFNLVGSTFYYFCSGKYNKEGECAINPFDKQIEYITPADRLKELQESNYLISDKDKNAASLKEWMSDPRSSRFVYGEC